MPGKIQHVLCTGDLCVKVRVRWLAETHFRHVIKNDRMQEVHDYLKSICTDLHVARGEFDDSSYPETKARFTFEQCVSYLLLVYDVL